MPTPVETAPLVSDQVFNGPNCASRESLSRTRNGNREEMQCRIVAALPIVPFSIFHRFGEFFHLGGTREKSQSGNFSIRLQLQSVRLRPTRIVSGNRCSEPQSTILRSC